MPGCWVLELSMTIPPRGRDEVLRHGRADRYLATVPTCGQTCGITQWVTGAFNGDSSSSLFCLLSTYSR